MHTMTTIEEQAKIQAFAMAASTAFAENKDFATYTSHGRVDEGDLLAFRWGMGGDCVLVVKLDEGFTPINFQQAIRRS